MKIQTLSQLMSAASIAVLLSACGSNNVAELNNTSFDRSTFAGAIAEDYLQFANFEANEMVDWQDAGHFADKALRILKDTSAAQREQAADWNIDERFQADLKAAARRLDIATSVLSFQEGGTELAKAISSYDCWIEQAEEGWQQDHIAECQSAFSEALVALENIADMKFTEQGTAKASVVLYHDHNKALPRSKDLALLQSFTAKYWDDLKMHIHIDGHADSSGTASYNANLSIGRAIAVVNAIETPWQDEYTISISGVGEAQLAHLTEDGVRDPRNRRTVIEVIFSPQSDVAPNNSSREIASNG